MLSARSPAKAYDFHLLPLLEHRVLAAIAGRIKSRGAPHLRGCLGTAGCKRKKTEKGFHSSRFGSFW
jgi:hypothetical protein